MVYPSLISHIFNGVLLFTGLIFIVLNFSKIRSFETYRILIILLIASIAIGVHGISHLLLEKTYGYNPLDIYRQVPNLSTP